MPFTVNSTTCIYSNSCSEPGSHFLIYDNVSKNFLVDVLAGYISGTSARPVNAVFQHP